MTTKQKIMAMRDLAYELQAEMLLSDKLDMHDTLDLRQTIRLMMTLHKRHGSKHVPVLEAAE